MRAEEFLTEGREKYNWDLHKPGFEFSQKINGITYTVKRKNQFLNVKARDKQGRKVGSTWFVNHQYKDALEAGQTFVDPEFRGQGIATNMYAVVRMLGANIHPSTTQSDDGKAMWSKWNQQGDAKHIKSMNAQMTEQGIEESANPADTLYFFDVARGGRSFDHLDLRIMGLKQSQKGRWYYQPGRDSTDLLTTATLKYLEKTLNVPARAWTKPVAETRIIDPERVDVYYRPVPGSRGRRVVARNIPTSTLEPLLKKLSEKYSVPVESFEWTPSEPITEAFDQPYAVQWTKQNGDWHATADLDDGSELIVLFMAQGDNQWMVEFERDENMEITGEGDAPRVFATVLTAMRQFIAKRKPAMLNFSAEKDDDPTGSRARLYDRMIQRYVTGTGYDLTREDMPGGATYTLTKQAPGVAEGSSHQHTEIFKHRVGDWIVYLDNHSVIRAMTRNIGPRMMSNLVTMVDLIPGLEDKVPKGGAFWIQDIKTNSSFYFKRLDIPSEPLAVRCETGVQDVPRANKQTPVFQVNAYTGPETKQDIQGMKQAKLRSKFVGTNTMANTLASNIQKGKLGGDDAIRNPATQDSKRYDTAFKQARQMDKEVDENFADGKGPGRPGDSVRHGIPKHATMAELEKASHAKGRKGQLARWQLNMRRGHKK